MTHRHRLNRGGDRQLNRALHTITMIRMRVDPATKAYIAKRAAEGKTSRDAQRCIKRALARTIFKLLERTTPESPVRESQTPHHRGLTRHSSLGGARWRSNLNQRIQFGPGRRRRGRPSAGEAPAASAMTNAPRSSTFARPGAPQRDRPIRGPHARANKPPRHPPATRAVGNCRPAPRRSGAVLVAVARSPWAASLSSRGVRFAVGRRFGWGPNCFRPGG